MVKLKYTIDVVLIAVSLISVLIFFNNMTARVIAPMNNQETMDTKVLFEIKNANYILIDDNMEFSSPEKIFLEDYLEISLSPGVYYWKLVGEFDNEIRKLTILSKVELSVRKQNDSSENSYEIINSGNEKLNVDVYDNDLLTERFSLSSSESVVKNGNKFIGGQA